ncbi:hypothetical protein CC1G_11538 [Coprinopsis cinerea okayama7|uniref:Translation initiation factor eIF2B subunit gamma n=1 Tax=Coprinopsis cinerea (strain Okayama-7 / 130 / ATCC MYA-4618 / FGSC 9003) TaxID=240176 RepID=A8N6S4_COPC7|nr:hypothetical protein CC1G_11538 [Coprinopsis cinerea okayama7\|eukprot:XP_001830530.1 hypothetical protein CC1G_11538 [Coprinopsis cinerea okayama7\
MDIHNVDSKFQKREFLAVLIAGFGNELLPLTSDHGDEPYPKALLPVANKPLLEYILSWLEQAGIKDVLLICPAIHRPALYHHIHSDVSSPSLRIDLQTYEETQESPAGTCELLRHFSNRITEDFVLVPCDFLAPPSLPLSQLLNTFRVESTSDNNLLTTCWYPVHVPDKTVLSDEWGPAPSPPAIVVDPATGSLLHIDTPDDRDRNNEDFQFSMGMISRFSRTKLTASFQDSHVYICQNKILSMLHQKKEFDSFREEFLPWLCRNQYRSLKLQPEGKTNDVSSSTLLSQSLALGHSTSSHLKQEDPSSAIPASPIKDDDKDGETSSNSDTSSESNYKVSIVIHSQDADQALRINTLYNFLEINRQLLSKASYALPTDPKDRSLIDQKAQISTDTIIGDSTQISERTTIKKSVIGKHCIIGKFVKISGCVLLDHCIVEDGAKLDGCILGKNTKVGAKAELSRCISCGGFEVNPGDVLKGEKLDINDWIGDSKLDDLPESDDEDSDEGDDDGDSDDSS